MVIYIESVFAFNVLVDYLLLFGAARVAGRTVARRRLLLGAAVGGIYAAVQLFLPKSVVLLLLGLALMGAAAYRGSGRAVKLTLLFFLASCGLAGVVMLLGQSLGSMARLARGGAVGRLPDRGGDVVFAAFRRVPLRRGADRERDGGCGHRLSRKNGPRAAAARHGQHAL